MQNTPSDHADNTVANEATPADHDPISAPGLGTALAILKPRKSRPFYGRHPWVLDSAIAKIEGNPRDGDIIQLLNEKRKFIARGIFNSQSKIRVRLYSWHPGEALDEKWLRTKLTNAVSLREQLGLLEPGDAARIVFSEADSLSGLIVDRFGAYLALQVNALAMKERLNEIVPILQELLRPKGIVVKQERGIEKLEGFSIAEESPESQWGEIPNEPIFVVENELKYGIDLRAGQKTGFYVDQRDNRRAAAKYAKGRRVLDMFCYSGGFGMNAAKHGEAHDVLCVDTSARAIALAEENAKLNGLTNMRFAVGDGFDKLTELASQGERFEMIVLDPPKFARSRGSVNDALMAYHKLNRMAVDLLEPGGILVTCSCSGHVTREDFQDMLAGVSQRSRRDIQFLEQRGPAADHPTSATCLEGEYLKCFICRVV